jgi:hypothetical protein
MPTEVSQKPILSAGAFWVPGGNCACIRGQHRAHEQDLHMAPESASSHAYS